MIDDIRLWRRLAVTTTLAAALGGCSADAPPPAPVAHDAVMAGALQAPLLVDPDLSGRNARNLAIVPPGPVLPPEAVPSSD